MYRGIRYRPTVHYVGSPITNDVAERRNMMLKDMVKSMIRNFTLSEHFREKYLRLQCISLT